ncbi:uncharacterized protein LOC132465990 [Gadus macrocephalus]|uniref:uncharacterized protein LOC132465990 n=1 Tax=Gadus macrocephalus TaxID=80720 RepID=UPI0028CBBC8B|nr:uncharacterized protein LOC132465990 [Gadus macrocephalus]
MSFAKIRITPSQQSVLRASDAAAAFTAAMGPRGPQAPASAKRPEEVEKEARPIGSRKSSPRLSTAQSATPHRLEGRPAQSATRIDSRDLSSRDAPPNQQPASTRGTSARGAPRPISNPHQHQLEENLPRVSAIISAFDDKMSFANLKMTPSHQLVLRASDAAAAFTAAMGPRGTQATARAKRPEEVEKEARARVVSEGGDPGNPMLVLGCHSIQLGKYQGQTFRWLLENDAGYACHLVASHQRERETSASYSPLMANKDSLARYSCAHPAFAEHLNPPTLPGRGGEALVGFGLHKEATLKDLCDSKEKERQNYVKWLRRKTPQPGSAMDVAIMYFSGRDKERSAEAAATPPPPASSSTSSGPSTTTSQAAASTVLPPRKPTAPNFNFLGRAHFLCAGVRWAQGSCRPRSGNR